MDLDVLTGAGFHRRQVTEHPERLEAEVLHLPIRVHFLDNQDNWPEPQSFRDVDYPGDSGPHVPIATNGRWHTLAVTVRGSAYVFSLDGRRVAHGTLPQAAEAIGGALVRVWSGGFVEIRTPVFTVNHG